MTRDDIYLVLVTGSRRWGESKPVYRDIEAAAARATKQGRTLVVVHGDAAGADTLGRVHAEYLGANHVAVPANWDRQGKSAGPHRNSIIAALFEFDEVLAYPLPGSKGTHDMTRKARTR